LWTEKLPQEPRSWSSDGQTLAVAGIGPETLSDIWLLTLDGATPRPWLQTAAAEIEPAISPNAQWIAYASNETGQYEVYVRPLSGAGKWQISTAGGREPVWARDGKELFYWSGNQMYVARVSAGGTFQHQTPTELIEGAYYRTTTGHAAYDVSDDGRFLMVKPEPLSSPKQLNVVLNWSEELERLVPTDN
jgi:Tol biopolymer transport system component